MGDHSSIKWIDTIKLPDVSNKYSWGKKTKTKTTIWELNTLLMFPNGAGRGLWMSPGWSRPLGAPRVTASGITISRPFHTIHTVKKKQTDEKARVVAAVGGTEFTQFHAAQYRFSTMMI